MFRNWLSTGFIGGFVLGIVATSASAGILAPGLTVLKAAPFYALEKVHEDMHQGCLRHKPPGGYPDCHWHYFNKDTGKWEIRRRLLDGTPCPKNCKWS